MPATTPPTITTSSLFIALVLAQLPVEIYFARYAVADAGAETNGAANGTALLTDAIPLGRRAKTQGMVDLGVGLAGSSGGIASGLVVATASYAVLGLSGALVALALLPTLLLARPRLAPTQVTQ